MKFRILTMVATCLWLTSCLGKSNHGKITVLNRSSEPIVKMDVKVPGKTMSFENIGPSQSAKAEYEVKSDGEFEITGSFKSGKQIQKKDGYITNGMDFDHEIIVDDNGISLNAKSVK